MAQPSTDAIIERYTGSPKPSTQGEPVLPGVDSLSNAQYSQIVKATLNNAKIPIGEVEFDGSKNYEPKDIAKLISRITSPNEFSVAMSKVFTALANDPGNAKVQEDFLHSLGQITEGKIPEKYDPRPKLGPENCGDYSKLLAQAGPINLGTAAQHVDREAAHRAAPNAVPQANVPSPSAQCAL